MNFRIVNIVKVFSSVVHANIMKNKSGNEAEGLN